MDGIFCHACAFFAPEKVGGIIPGQFITKSFKSWVKRCDKMEEHARLAYHMEAMTKLDGFVVRFEHPSETIDTQLNRETQEMMEENQKVIESLLRIVMMCGSRESLSVDTEMTTSCGQMMKSLKQKMKAIS